MAQCVCCILITEILRLCVHVFAARLTCVVFSGCGYDSFNLSAHTGKVLLRFLLRASQRGHVLFPSHYVCQIFSAGFAIVCRLRSLTNSLALCRTVASYFGRVCRYNQEQIRDVKKENLALAVLKMITNNIGKMIEEHRNC